MERTCSPLSSQQSSRLYISGYISSPNYPDKYYMNADCHWVVGALPHQTIRLTVLDFELDVRRSMGCFDVLRILSSEGVEYFNDCGVLGKQVVEVNSSLAIIRFSTGQAGLPQRGFLLHYQGWITYIKLCSLD